MIGNQIPYHLQSFLTVFHSFFLVHFCEQTPASEFCQGHSNSRNIRIHVQLCTSPERYRAVRSSTKFTGEARQKGQLRSRITVTLSIFNFSTRFFAQIVENRETQLSSPFLGSGDNFSKSYDENQIWPNCVYARAGSMRRSQVPYSCHTNLFSS